MLRNHVKVPTPEELDWQARELSLFIDNDRQMYNEKMRWFKNMWAKYKAGKFNSILARKGFANLTREAAKKHDQNYSAEYRIGMAARKVIDTELVSEFITAAKNKEYEFMR